MSRQEEALRIAEEVLADVELKRLKTSEIVLKASRLARLIGQSELIEFLALERDGYPGDGTDNYWIGRAGRWSDASKEKFFPAPIAKIDSQIEATRQALDTLAGGGNYSGEYASVAAREHDKKITSYSSSRQQTQASAGKSPRLCTASWPSFITNSYSVNCKPPCLRRHKHALMER
ncbi:hypothetical protein QF038_000036 [Pseudarthrobacter sp. W1I19]|uniref:AbiTii domain-containing protein n=1 Tax=Pseudarthrobacter sp. W1I19 TaxID=3042288 RepID=UPI002782E810|nr:hypothetical protein [Pseudarthrobacter sp. W1I19]MDQ0921528.1 hypothetical protein [Pseudarthrobacter sp. W1I19]